MREQSPERRAYAGKGRALGYASLARGLLSTDRILLLIGGSDPPLDMTQHRERRGNRERSLTHCTAKKVLGADLQFAGNSANIAVGSLGRHGDVQQTMIRQTIPGATVLTAD
jgi:hypothetical protein